MVDGRWLMIEEKGLSWGRRSGRARTIPSTLNPRTFIWGSLPPASGVSSAVSAGRYKLSQGQKRRPYGLCGTYIMQTEGRGRDLEDQGAEEVDVPHHPREQLVHLCGTYPLAM